MSLDNFKIGVGTHLGQASNTVYQNWATVKNALDDLGINRIRDDIYWSYVETTPGTIDTSQATAAIQAMIADPGAYTGVLIASYGNSFYGDDQPDDPAARTAFAAYWNQLVTDFGSDFESFEVWNEWNLGAGNPGNVADADSSGASYALLVDALTIPEPTPEVITGATGDDLSDWQFTKDFFASGSFAAGDAYSVHLYNYNNGSGAVPEEMIARLERLQEILRTYNSGQDYPVYVTEFGWPTDSGPTGTTELLSGSYLSRFLLEASGYSWIEGAWIYDLFNDGVDPANREHNFGLYENDGTTEKAGTKYVKAAIALMKDYTFVSKGYVSSTVRYLEFAHDTNSNYAYVIFDSEKDGSKAISIDYTPVEFAAGAISSLSTIATADYTITEEPQIIVTNGAVELSPSSDQLLAISDGGTGVAAEITHGRTFEVGEVIFAFVHTNYGTTAGITDNNGATPFTRDFMWDDGLTSGQQIAIFTRVATGTEPATFSFSIADGSQRYSIHVRSYRGLDGSNIWDVPPHIDNLVTGGSQGITIPGISTRSMYAEALAFLGTDTGAATIYSGVTNSFYDELEQQLDQPSATYRKAITNIGPVGDSSVTASVGGQTFALMMAIKNGRYATPTVLANQNLNTDDWTPDVDGNLIGLDKTGGGNSPGGGGGGESAVGVRTFVETFNSALAAPWYDNAVSVGHLTGTNPLNGSQCYRYEWLAGQSAYPLDQSARVLYGPTDLLKVEFYAWVDPATILDNNDHCVYVRLNTSAPYQGPAAGNGFTLYIQPEANGQTEVEWRLSDDVTWRSHVTAGAPTWNSGTPIKITAIMEMNTAGQADGRLRVLINDVVYINEFDCEFRLAANEQFEQILIGPDLEQVQTSTVSMYVDEMTLDDWYQWNANTWPYDPDRVFWRTVRYASPTGSNGNDGQSTSTPYGNDLEYAAEQLSPGQILLLMAGTFDASVGTGEAGGYRLEFNVQNGTVNDPILITTQPGAESIIDCNGAVGFSVYATTNWHFKHLFFLNYTSGIRCGYNAEALGLAFLDIDGETNTGVDNGGLIDFTGAGPCSGTVSRCRSTLTVPHGSVVANTAGFMIIDISHQWDIQWDHIESHGYNKPFYFKTGGSPTPSEHLGIQVIRDAFFTAGDGAQFALGDNAGGVLIRNTIMDGNVILGEASGSSGGDWNFFDHVIISGTLQLRDQPQNGNVGSINNRLMNSIVGDLNISPESSVTADSDYNMFGAPVQTNIDFIGQGSAVSHTLSEWQALNNSDANSLYGSPVYVDSDMTLVSSWQLAAGSPGLAAAEDGTDIGVDVRRIGVFGAE